MQTSGECFVCAHLLGHTKWQSPTSLEEAMEMPGKVRQVSHRAEGLAVLCLEEFRAFQRSYSRLLAPRRALGPVDSWLVPVVGLSLTSQSLRFPPGFLCW
ncbi:hypothetical protein GOODEAATRI_024062 [Goodea atripinnis]|uniref:Uncharacterized protein n=1 Tax=Goodea atripinnis TaxID=208336 RepID=A0ABV0ND28_9TELE